MPEASGTLALGIGCGLAAALCYGISDVSASVVSRRRSSLFAAAGMQVTLVAAYVLFAIAAGIRFPSDPAILARIAFWGCVVGLAYLTAVEAFRIGPLAVVGPILSLTGGLSAVLSVLFLGERLTVPQGIGIIAATCGLALMAVVFEVDLRRSRLVSRGVTFALVATILWSSTVIGLTGLIRQVGWEPVMVESRIASAAILWCIVGLTWAWAVLRKGRARSPGGVGGEKESVLEPGEPPTAGRTVPDWVAIGLVALMGVIEALGFALVAFGLEQSQAWVVALTSSLGPTVVLAFGVLALHERLRPVQWVGIALVFVSLILISLP